MAWESHPQCSLRDLQELMGFLQFCSQVILHAWAFVQRLINFSITFKLVFSGFHITAYTHTDIRWWALYAKHGMASNFWTLLTPQSTSIWTQVVPRALVVSSATSGSHPDAPTISGFTISNSRKSTWSYKQYS